MNVKEFTNAVQVIDKSLLDIKHLAAKAEIAKYILQEPKYLQPGHNFSVIAQQTGIDSNEFGSIMNELRIESEQLYKAFQNSSGPK